MNRDTRLLAIASLMGVLALPLTCAQGQAQGTPTTGYKYNDSHST
jgi:hypothetical protein